MIPKIIHYCWFGRGEKPLLVRDCIDSWKKNLVDYQFIEWNEDNFDINQNKYVQQAYQARKWAFVSDYVRLWALYSFGGIYLDTDVEVLKSLDPFLDRCIFSGYESKDMPITAVFGSEPHRELIREMLDYYANTSFIKKDGTYNLLTNTFIITDILKSKGMKPNGKFQVIDEMTVYPQEFFCPNNFVRIFNLVPQKSYAIHHFEGSWQEKKKKNLGFLGRFKRYIVGKLRNFFGTNFVNDLSKRVKRK